MENQSVILAGDPVSGLTVWGPFDTADDATEWAEASLKGMPWTLAKLYDQSNL